MTEKEFLNLINKADDKFLGEAGEVFDPLKGTLNEFEAAERKIMPSRDKGKRRVPIRPLAYTAAILAAVIGAGVFGSYTRESDDIYRNVYVGEAENGILYGNIPQNSKISSPLGGMICPSEQGLYFSNLRDGEKIYRYIGGESKLVVDMPARFINCYGGRLYFISPEYSATVYDNIFYGKLYSYDIETERLKRLTDSETVTSLTVTDEGLYYNVITPEAPSADFSSLELRLADLDGSNERKCGYGYALRYGDNLIDSGGLHALTDDRLDIAYDISDSVQTGKSLSGACVCKNLLLTQSEYTVSITDLDKDRASTLNFDFEYLLKSELPYGSFAEYEITDYIILKNTLYVAYNSSNIIEITDIDSKPAAKKITAKDTDFIYSRLYTDGERLYALGCETYDYKNAYIVELKTNSGFLTRKEIN